MSTASRRSPPDQLRAANEPRQEWFTPAEAANYLRVPSASAVYQRVARGQMRTYRLGRQMRFRRSDLDALMRAT
jgi:excisionase family DNA binding protein